MWYRITFTRYVCVCLFVYRCIQHFMDYLAVIKTRYITTYSLSSFCGIGTNAVTPLRRLEESCAVKARFI